MPASFSVTHMPPSERRAAPRLEAQWAFEPVSPHRKRSEQSMCGIAGAVDWGDRDSLERMTRILAHRGPDDGGVWETREPDGTWVGLGSRRLAILDLSAAGRMPMTNPDGSLQIVYNGEVYNFVELK